MFKHFFNQLRTADEAACSAVVRALDMPMGGFTRSALYALGAVLGFACAILLGGTDAMGAVLCAMILFLWQWAMMGSTLSIVSIARREAD